MKQKKSKDLIKNRNKKRRIKMLKAPKKLSITEQFPAECMTHNKC